MDGSEGKGDLVLIQTFFALLWKLVLKNTSKHKNNLIYRFVSKQGHPRPRFHPSVSITEEAGQVHLQSLESDWLLLSYEGGLALPDRWSRGTKTLIRGCRGIKIEHEGAINTEEEDARKRRCSHVR